MYFSPLLTRQSLFLDPKNQNIIFILSHCQTKPWLRRGERPRTSMWADQAGTVLNIQELWIYRSLININQYKAIWTISSWNYEPTGSWSVTMNEYYHDFCPFITKWTRKTNKVWLAKMVKDISLLRNAKPPRPPAPRRRKGRIGDIYAPHSIRLFAGPSGI